MGAVGATFGHSWVSSGVAGEYGKGRIGCAFAGTARRTASAAAAIQPAFGETWACAFLTLW
jgi:hypothetical protein